MGVMSIQLAVESLAVYPVHSCQVAHNPQAVAAGATDIPGTPSMFQYNTGARASYILAFDLCDPRRLHLAMSATHACF